MKELGLENRSIENKMTALEEEGKTVVIAATKQQKILSSSIRGGTNMEKVIKVEGMTCNHCKMAVEGALKKLNGVDSAVVSLENKNVTVSFIGDITFDQMKEAIEDQGYDVVEQKYQYIF